MGRALIADGRSVATFAVVAVLSQFVVKCACSVSGIRRRLPIGSQKHSTAGQQELCLVVLLLLNIFVLSCAFAG